MSTYCYQYNHQQCTIIVYLYVTYYIANYFFDRFSANTHLSGSLDNNYLIHSNYRTTRSFSHYYLCFDTLSMTEHLLQIFVHTQQYLLTSLNSKNNFVSAIGLGYCQLVVSALKNVLLKNCITPFLFTGNIISL